jgi:hypothetical protein
MKPPFIGSSDDLRNSRPHSQNTYTQKVSQHTLTKPPSGGFSLPTFKPLQALLPLPYVPSEKQALLGPFKALLAAFFRSIIIMVWQCSDKAHEI